MRKTKNNQLEAKCYWSPDIGNPWDWTPEQNEVFYLLEINIGDIYGDAANIYSIIVATPEGILSMKEKNPLNGVYKILLLNDYSWERVVHIINSIVSKIYAREELNKYLDLKYQSMKQFSVTSQRSPTPG